VLKRDRDRRERGSKDTACIPCAVAAELPKERA
jgi:hypothetical protein